MYNVEDVEKAIDSNPLIKGRNKAIAKLQLPKWGSMSIYDIKEAFKILPSWVASQVVDQLEFELNYEPR